MRRVILAMFTVSLTVLTSVFAFPRDASALKCTIDYYTYYDAPGGTIVGTCMVDCDWTNYCDGVQTPYFDYTYECCPSPTCAGVC